MRLASKPDRKVPFFTHAWLAVALLALAGGVGAQLQYQEGTHYLPLRNVQPTPDSDRVEVIEFFSYGCSHCYEFEPQLEEWIADQPAHVNFVRIPAGLGRAFFQQLAATFYIADALGVRGEAHNDLFEEIHEQRNMQIASLEGLAEFFSGYGVDREQFLAAVNSEDVRREFADAQAAAPRYDVMGVPTMIVNGKYRVVRNEHVRSYEEMLDIVDFLVAAEAD